MRNALAAAALLLALPVAAQVGTAPPPDEAGLYGELGVSGGYASSVGALQFGHAAVGVQLGNGLSLGLHGKSFAQGITSDALAIGPEARLTRALDARTRLDLYASASVGAFKSASLAETGYQLSGIGTQMGASATRRYALGRGITFAATGGGYVGAGQRFAVGTVEGGPEASAGVIVGAQLEFEVLGASVAVGPRGTIPALRTGPALGEGGGLYRAGGGQPAGFLTIRF